MEFVQLQINYADWENPAVQSRACYEVARKHGKPVIIMEPVKGGMLATPPESVEKILKDTEPDASPASCAVRFAANLAGVITVLSGMSNVEQMQDNLSYMKTFDGLSEKEKENPRQSAGRIKEDPADPMYNLQLLCKSLSEGDRNFRFFHGNELSDSVRKQTAGTPPGKLARRRPRQKIRNRMCQMRQMRRSLSTAHQDP